MTAVLLQRCYDGVNMLTVWAALGKSSSLQSVLSCSPEWGWREGGGEIGRRAGMGKWRKVRRDWRWAKFKFKAAERDWEPRASWGGAVIQTQRGRVWGGLVDRQELLTRVWGVRLIIKDRWTLQSVQSHKSFLCINASVSNFKYGCSISVTAESICWKILCY